MVNLSSSIHLACLKKTVDDIIFFHLQAPASYEFIISLTNHGGCVWVDSKMTSIGDHILS